MNLHILLWSAHLKCHRYTPQWVPIHSIIMHSDKTYRNQTAIDANRRPATRKAHPLLPHFHLSCPPHLSFPWETQPSLESFPTSFLKPAHYGKTKPHLDNGNSNQSPQTANSLWAPLIVQSFNLAIHCCILLFIFRFIAKLILIVFLFWLTNQ